MAYDPREKFTQPIEGIGPIEKGTGPQTWLSLDRRAAYAARIAAGEDRDKILTEMAMEIVELEDELREEGLLPELEIPEEVLQAALRTAGDVVGHEFHGNQWTQGTSGDYSAYHGTSAAAAEGILRDGLRAEFSGQSWGPSEKDTVYVTTNEDEAKIWAELKIRPGYSHDPQKVPAIVEIDVPPDQLSTFLPDRHVKPIFDEKGHAQHPGGMPGQLEHIGDVPASWIRSVKVRMPRDPSRLVPDKWFTATLSDGKLTIHDETGRLVALAEGRTRYYVVILLDGSLRTAEYDESKHPRDERGQWTEGGGDLLETLPGKSDTTTEYPSVVLTHDVKLYHVTRLSADTVERRGLRPGLPTEISEEFGDDKSASGVYLTSRAVAERYREGRYQGGGTLVEVLLPAGTRVFKDPIDQESVFVKFRVPGRGVRVLDDKLRTAEYDDLRAAGGPGSGHFDHAGRPGHVGGSAKEDGGSTETSINHVTAESFISHIKSAGYRTQEDLGTLPKDLLDNLHPKTLTPLPQPALEGVDEALHDLETKMPTLANIFKAACPVVPADYTPESTAVTVTGPEGAWMLINGSPKAQQETQNPGNADNTVGSRVARDKGLSGDDYVREVYHGSLLHEAGHFADALTAGGLTNAVLDTLILAGKFDPNGDQSPFMRWAAKNISPYATSSPQEMTAEIFAATVLGRQLPPELHPVRDQILKMGREQ